MFGKMRSTFSIGISAKQRENNLKHSLWRKDKENHINSITEILLVHINRDNQLYLTLLCTKGIKHALKGRYGPSNDRRRWFF